MQTPMAQGRSTKIISMMKWIRSSRLLIKNSLWQVSEGSVYDMLNEVKLMPSLGEYDEALFRHLNVLLPNLLLLLLYYSRA